MQCIEKWQTTRLARRAIKKKYQDYLNTENFQQQFTNCSVYRLSLFILREELLEFIEKEFNKFITEQKLSDSNKSDIKEKIKDKVRKPTCASSDQSLANKAKNRISLIKKLDPENITIADWRTIANCYTGNFNLKKQATFDAKDLLETLMYCTLFHDSLYPAASAVIEDRNKYYGHASALVIDSDTLKTLESSIRSLLELIPA